MIEQFRHKGLRKFYETGSKVGIKPEFSKRLRLILARLDAAQLPEDMDLPGLNLHELKGNGKGTYAVKVSGNCRITFRIVDGDVFDVDYLDYH